MPALVRCFAVWRSSRAAGLSRQPKRPRAGAELPVEEVPPRLGALLDRVLGRFVREPFGDDWVEDLGRFARAHRRVLDEHP